MTKTLVSYILILIVAVTCTSLAEAQYSPINVAPRTSSIVESSNGIVVESIVPYGNGCRIKLFNSNYNEVNDRTSYTFVIYLSYKGHRVSDYQNITLRCRYDGTYDVPLWPGEVPSQYQNTVTVQFGKESRTRDRRDDY